MRGFVVGIACAAAGLLAAAPCSAQTPVGSFHFFDRSGPDAARASITTLAEESFVTGAGGLTWACDAGEMQLIVSSTYLGRSMRSRVRWAFDGEEPGPTEDWILRRTGLAVIAPEETEAEFTRRALESRRVQVQLTDYQFRRHSYTFGLDGLAEALSMLPCEAPARP